MGKTIVGIASALGLMFGFAIKGLTAPGYDQGRQELEWVMERLIEWLPGAWDSFPQVWYERNVREPSQGEEHDYWHRTFVRIDAPQVGEVVFYGQINVGGRDGPMMPGSQVLYHAVIDERLGAVNIFGQGPLDPNSYTNGIVPYLTWWQSEYVRLRGEYGYLENDLSGQSENRFTLELTWAAGPHKHETY